MSPFLKVGPLRFQIGDLLSLVLINDGRWKFMQLTTNDVLKTFNSLHINHFPCLQDAFEPNTNNQPHILAVIKLARYFLLIKKKKMAPVLSWSISTREGSSTRPMPAVPTKENVDTIRDRVKVIDDSLHVSFILRNEQGKTKVSASGVPTLRTRDQKRSTSIISRENLRCFETVLGSLKSARLNSSQSNSPILQRMLPHQLAWWWLRSGGFQRNPSGGLRTEISDQ